jgi:hypothetical protein
MPDLSAIADIQPADVHSVISRTLSSGVDAEPMSEFLAGLDWGEVTEADSPLAALLLNLLNWTTMYEENELSRTQYARKLRMVLPKGKAVAITST